MPEGLDDLGVYSGRGPSSQTAEMTISTGPSQQPAPVQNDQTSSSGPQEGVRPSDPGPDLIGELGKAFNRTIGEPPPHAPEPPKETIQPDARKPDDSKPVQEPEKPKEKTWRDQEPPPSFAKKAQEDWRHFRQKAISDVEARESRIKELEQTIQNFQTAAPKNQEEINLLKKQLSDSEGVVERVAVERSPLFKSKVLDPEEQLRARMGKVLDGTGVSASEAETMLHGDLNTRERILEGRQMSAFRRQQIADLLSKWDNVAEERDRLTSRGRESLQQYLQEQQRQQETARAQFMREAEQVFENQFSLAKPKLEVYNHIEGNDAWNKNADALKTVAMRLYSGNVSREMVAQAAILAPAAVAYQNLLKAAYGQIQELKGQLDKVRGVQPEVRDTGGDVSQPGQILSSPNGDFVKNLVSRFQKETGLQ